jgi:hypothetical protein
MRIVVISNSSYWYILNVKNCKLSFTTAIGSLFGHASIYHIDSHAHSFMVSSSHSLVFIQGCRSNASLRCLFVTWLWRYIELRLDQNLCTVLEGWTELSNCTIFTAAVDLSPAFASIHR